MCVCVCVCVWVWVGACVRVCRGSRPNYEREAGHLIRPSTPRSHRWRSMQGARSTAAGPLMVSGKEQRNVGQSNPKAGAVSPTPPKRKLGCCPRV